MSLRPRGGSRGREEGPAPGSTMRSDPYSAARDIVLRQLAAAPRTRAQLAAALARRGVPREVAAAVLDRLEEVDLVDDADFARQWVRSRGGGHSRRALSHELAGKGVPDGVIREAVEQISPGDELVAARELVRRKLPSMRGDDPARRARRLTGMLARRGYDSATVYRAVREACAEDAEEADGTAELLDGSAEPGW